MVKYCDFASTTPVLPEVADFVVQLMCEQYGNSGSRTHKFGQDAKKCVNNARKQIARASKFEPDEVIFTSGATESNNLAFLGLRDHLFQTGRNHIISVKTEHKAVLEPLEHLAANGFEVTLLSPLSNGTIDLNELSEAIHDRTGLISIMQVNNETGVIQPLDEVCELLNCSDVFLHVDAAQGFGKIELPENSHRIDLMSISGHKIYAPKGIGALLSRKRNYQKLPLRPIMYGGGQEQGLRPGTLPVALIGGFGLAAELAFNEYISRTKIVKEALSSFIDAFENVGGKINGETSRLSPFIRNISIPGLDAEAAMVILKEHIAVSNGSACTSASYTHSHVLNAMSMPASEIESSIRFSFSHLSPPVDWKELFTKIRSVQLT